MKEANRQLKPVCPVALSAPDREAITRAASLVYVDANSLVDLQAISDSRPEVSGALREMQVATLKLALMLPRSMLEQLVERVIEWLDEVDGDPDLELVDEREPESEY